VDPEAFASIAKQMMSSDAIELNGETFPVRR